MKTAVKVFSIIAIVLNVISALVYLIVGFALASGSEDIIKAVQSAGSDIAVSTLMAIYFVLGFWSIVRIVISVLSIRKVSKPIEKKPVGLGIVNIFFGSFIGGILLLCLSPEQN